MQGLHRDVQRLSDGRLIAEGWGKLEETGGVEAGANARILSRICRRWRDIAVSFGLFPT
jgi:hypothetical protein